MKACENMFDAIISKYQRSLADLEKREQILKQKEKEIDEKLSNFLLNFIISEILYSK